MTEMSWRKSSFSGQGQTNCVEVKPLADGGVQLRDTKDRSLAAHTYTRDEWIAFVQGAKAGEFDFA